MQCDSCEKDVPDEMTASLDTNFCPYCGNAVMSEDVNSLRSHVVSVLVSSGKVAEQDVAALASVLTASLTGKVVAPPLAARSASSRPERAAPAKKTPPKRISRSGEPLAPASGEVDIMSMSEDQLEAIVEEIPYVEEDGPSGMMDDLSDEDFFPESGEVSEESEEVLLGITDKAMQAKAERLKRIKKAGPVSRAS